MKDCRNAALAGMVCRDEDLSGVKVGAVLLARSRPHQDDCDIEYQPSQCREDCEEDNQDLGCGSLAAKCKPAAKKAGKKR